MPPQPLPRAPARLIAQAPRKQGLSKGCALQGQRPETAKALYGGGATTCWESQLDSPRVRTPPESGRRGNTLPRSSPQRTVCVSGSLLSPAPSDHEREDGPGTPAGSVPAAASMTFLPVPSLQAPPLGCPTCWNTAPALPATRSLPQRGPSASPRSPSHTSKSSCGRSVHPGLVLTPASSLQGGS